jgi:hypothetical protein
LAICGVDLFAHPDELLEIELRTGEDAQLGLSTISYYGQTIR